MSIAKSIPLQFVVGAIIIALAVGYGDLACRWLYLYAMTDYRSHRRVSMIVLALLLILNIGLLVKGYRIIVFINGVMWSLAACFFVNMLFMGGGFRAGFLAYCTVCFTFAAALFLSLYFRAAPKNTTVAEKPFKRFRHDPPESTPH